MSKNPESFSSDLHTCPSPRCTGGKRLRAGLATILASGISVGLAPASHAESPVTVHKAVATSNLPPKDTTSGRLRYNLTHAYIPGSVKLTSTEVNGAFLPHIDREIVSAHINYSVNKRVVGSKINPRYLTVDGAPLPPRETVIGPGCATRLGVVDWATYPSNGDINLEVELTPYLGSQEVTRKYREYLGAVSLHGNNGKPLAAEFYSGTLEVSGHNGHLDSVQIIDEPDVQRVQLIEPHHAWELWPSNDNPHNG